MAEWFKAAVLKTVVRATVPWVQIPLSPPIHNTLWCNGSTTGFDPVSLGSNPGGVAKKDN